MAKYNAKSIFGDKEITTTQPSTNSSYKAMVPPTNKVDADTLEIIGFVDGVTITDWKLDEEKHQLVITFGAPDGSSTRHWITDPEFDGRITKQEDPSKQELMAGYTLKEIKGIAQKYIYTNAINDAIIKLGDEWEFSDYVKTIGELVMGEKNRTNQEISLKLQFKDATGTEPSYRIGKSPYLGVTNDATYGVKFVTEKDPYNDIITFSYIEKLPDFSNGSDDISSIFSSAPAIAL